MKRNVWICTLILTMVCLTFVLCGSDAQGNIDDIVAHFKTEMYAQYTIQVHDMLPYDDEYKTIIKKINELLLSS